MKCSECGNDRLQDIGETMFSILQCTQCQHVESICPRPVCQWCGRRQDWNNEADAFICGPDESGCEGTTRHLKDILKDRGP